MRCWRGIAATVVWLSWPGGARAADSSIFTPASATVSIDAAAPSATLTADAERLAKAEAELAALKHEREIAAARPQWWEYTCMGCVSAVTILMIVIAMVL
jgi:hypothetical protein